MKKKMKYLFILIKMNETEIKTIYDDVIVGDIFYALKNKQYYSFKYFQYMNYIQLNAEEIKKVVLYFKDITIMTNIFPFSSNVVTLLDNTNVLIFNNYQVGNLKISAPNFDRIVKTYEYIINEIKLKYKKIDGYKYLFGLEFYLRTQFEIEIREQFKTFLKLIDNSLKNIICDESYEEEINSTWFLSRSWSPVWYST